MVVLGFQYPEYQLFEETILKDVSFGPKNFGASEEEAEAKAKEMLKIVGLDESYYEKSPFECSGGEKRRVAIAGILAMEPEILVLDEPTAGLDPKGAKDMMQLFVDIQKQYKKMILLVTHDMEHVLAYCQRVVVISHGKIKRDCDVQTFFSDVADLKAMNINPPAVIRLREALIERGFAIDHSVLDMNELAKQVAGEVKR